METMIKLEKNLEDNFIDIISHLEEKGTMQIYNRMGITLKKIETDENIQRIDISDIPDGVYFLKIQFGDNSKTIRFTKN